MKLMSIYLFPRAKQSEKYVEITIQEDVIYLTQKMAVKGNNIILRSNMFCLTAVRGVVVAVAAANALKA